LKLGEVRAQLKGAILKMSLGKCVFCGKEQEDFRGTYYMKNDGSKNYYCSSKCMKSSLKLKRDKKKFRWAEGFHVMRDKKRVREKAKKEEIRK
jgi:large subunit ribosomal protein L24e